LKTVTEDDKRLMQGRRQQQVSFAGDYVDRKESISQRKKGAGWSRKCIAGSMMGRYAGEAVDGRK